MYYIYEKSSTYIIGKPDSNGIARPDHRCSYKTLGAAKAALTRLSKVEPDFDPDRYDIASSAFFHQNLEKKVKRKVLEGFGGKEYWEPVNTPNYLSPSSETYWSM